MAIRSLLLFVLTLGSIGSAFADPSGPFVWGETTPMANAGWGRMARLGEGRWLGVNTLYPPPNSILQIEISGDGAHTWTPLSTVAEPGRNLDNGEVIALPNGDLLLTGRSVVETKTPGGTLSFHLPVYKSRNGGKTWTFLSQIDTSEPAPYQPGQPSLGLWEPHFFFVADGRLACAYANEKRAADPTAYSQIVSEKVSPDNGATWGSEIVLAAQSGGGRQRPGMPVLTRMKNGQYLAVYEIVGIGRCRCVFQDLPRWHRVAARHRCPHSQPARRPLGNFADRRARSSHLL